MQKRTKLQHSPSITFRVQTWLSHHPMLYALTGGTGVVIFWRGVWHTVDYATLIVSRSSGQLITNELVIPWWDGPLSLLVGTLILILVGAFVSSLIGNEIIISGLRAEKHVTEKEEKTIRAEAEELKGIQRVLLDVTGRLDELEHAMNAKEAKRLAKMKRI